MILQQLCPTISVDLETTKLIQDRFRNFCECDGCGFWRALGILSVEQDLHSLLEELGLPDWSTVFPVFPSDGDPRTRDFLVQQWAWPLAADGMKEEASNKLRLDSGCRIWLTKTPPIRGDLRRKIVVPKDLLGKPIIWMIATILVPRPRFLTPSIRTERYRDPCLGCGCRTYVTFYFKRKAPFIKVLRDRGLASAAWLHGTRLKCVTCVRCGRQRLYEVDDKGPFFNKSIERPETKAFLKEWRSRSGESPGLLRPKRRFLRLKRSRYRRKTKLF